MILVIRIHGKVGVPKKIKETLYRLRLRKKYSAILMKGSQENQKLLKKIRNYIAYGEIDKDLLKELVNKRAKPLKLKGKIDSEKTIQALENLEKNSLKDLEIKPFFSLHPPSGGIESKKHFGQGKGILGDNKEKINDLLGRML